MLQRKPRPGVFVLLMIVLHSISSKMIPDAIHITFPPAPSGKLGDTPDPRPRAEHSICHEGALRNDIVAFPYRTDVLYWSRPARHGAESERKTRKNAKRTRKANTAHVQANVRYGRRGRGPAPPGPPARRWSRPQRPCERGGPRLSPARRRFRPGAARRARGSLEPVPAIGQSPAARRAR